MPRAPPARRRSPLGGSLPVEGGGTANEKQTGWTGGCAKPPLGLAGLVVSRRSPPGGGRNRLTLFGPTVPASALARSETGQSRSAFSRSGRSPWPVSLGRPCPPQRWLGRRPARAGAHFLARAGLPGLSLWADRARLSAGSVGDRPEQERIFRIVCLLAGDAL
jgi:hypothetical protein